MAGSGRATGERAAGGPDGPVRPFGSRSSWGPLAIAAALLLAAAFLRLAALESDPFQAVGTVFVSDEGWWAHNARNHYLFGAFRVDDWNQGLFLAPLHTLLLRASFEGLGLGVVQARLPSALSGILVVALVGVLLARTSDRSTALLGMAILALDPFHVAYSRVALVEMLPLAGMMIAVVLAAPAPRRRDARDAAAGAAAMLALLAKLNAFLFLPILAAGVALWSLREGGGGARALRRIACVLAGAAAVALPWLVFLVLPQREGWWFEIERVLGENAAPKGLYLLTKGFAIGASEAADEPAPGAFLRFSLVPVVLSLLWALRQLARALSRGPGAALRALCFAEVASAAWLALSLAAFWVTATPDRRFVWVTAPCAILAAHAVRGAGEPGVLGASPPQRRLRLRLLGAALALALAVYLRFPLAAWLAPRMQAVSLGQEPGLSAGTLCALAVLPLCALGALLGPALARGLRAVPLRWASVAWVALVATGTASAAQLAHEATHRSYEMRAASQVLRALVGDEAAVAGGSADTLFLDAPNRTLVIHDRTELGVGVYGLDYLDEVDPGYLVLDGAIDLRGVPDAVDGLLQGRRSAVPSSARVFRGERQRGDDGEPLVFTVVRLTQRP